MQKMKVAIESDFREVLERQLKLNGLALESQNPEVVISLGGDGTFLLAEDKYPGIPKLFIKHFSNCKDCKSHNFSGIFRKLKNKEYTLLEFKKLNAKVNGTMHFTGMNDINLHYKVPRAVRFKLYVNERQINGVIIGDGIIVSTPYGSSGYFDSIVHKTFKKGIGVAFNNSRTKLEYLLLKDSDCIKVIIERGPALLAADCQPKILPLKNEDVIEITVAGQKAKLLQLHGCELRVKDY